MTTDITELAQREKFEAWWEREYKHLESSKYTDAVPHIKYGFWMAYQAGGAELVEALEKAQQKADVYNMLREDCNLRGKGIGLANFVDWQAKRIAELEFICTSADKVQREFADELGCAGDNESILQAIEDLKVQSSTALELKQAALADNAHLKLELGILESSHKKLREGMAAIYNAICADGASTSVSAILTFVKRAHAESADAGIKVEAE